MIRKAKKPAYPAQKDSFIRMDGRTAFLAALFITVFFLFIQLLVLIYSFYVVENMGRIISGMFSRSEYYVELILAFVENVTLLYLFFRIEFRILARFAPEARQPWLLFSAMLPAVCILSAILSQVTGIWFKDELTAYQYSIIQFIKDLILYFTSVLVTSLIYLIIKNQERIEENKNLIIENFRNRYDALRNQTDPHFLFNSLNSLSGLIGYDDDRAHEYLEQLSSVFRYTMREHSVATLAEELEFAASYIYLMKIRYGDVLTVDVRVPDSVREYSILPFAIQTLVENAVKHNIVSRHKPLRLVIRLTDDETIAVENNLQPRHGVTPGGGLGLSNLSERYWLMFRKNIRIEASESRFRVEIPLIRHAPPPPAGDGRETKQQKN
ncbi:MAG: histidine kinase [Proteiniphilum sp.]|nr:histidine kinase [Proteiniphilum sp.]